MPTIRLLYDTFFANTSKPSNDRACFIAMDRISTANDYKSRIPIRCRDLTQEPDLDETNEVNSLAVLVHDLNNALSPATLLTDLLLATEVTEEKRLDYMKRIQNSVARAKVIIGRIEEQIAAGN